MGRAGRVFIEGVFVSNTIVSSSVDVAANVTTYNKKAAHVKNETSDGAISLDDLNQETTTITLSDSGAAATSAVSATFTSGASGLVSLTKTAVTGTSNVRYQLYDSSGNIVADSSGTTAQVAAYNDWASGTLEIDAGTYTATATPPSTAADSTATTKAGTLSINTSEQQSTSLDVNSQLTGSDKSEYYKFVFTGSTMKLDFDATTNANSARVVVYNSAGNIVADSQGDSYQKSQYQKLTSGTGLSETSGEYSVKVTYADGADPTTQNVNYNLQLYAGDSYSVIYKEKVTAKATDNTAAGSVTATSTAEMYSTSAYNKIKTTVKNAVNIGWMKQDQAMLDVYSQLTSADSTDTYKFTYQSGTNLKFGFNTSSTKDTSNLRVQLLDSTGSVVIADSEGTTDQQAAYKKLTTTDGLTASTGTYVIKISYAKNATKTDTTYEFGVYSGSTYASEYQTTASAETYAHAVANNEVTGTSAATKIAAYLTAQSNGTSSSSDSSLTDALKSFV